jgi:hypothetical protein
MGCNIPLLPYNINLYYNKLWVKFVRVLGGISVILYITENCKYFGIIEDYIVLFALIHTIHIIIIFIIKIVYSFIIFKYVESLTKKLYINKFVLYLTLVFRFIILIVMELIGFLGFEFGQYVELCSHIYDINKVTKDNKSFK